MQTDLTSAEDGREEPAELEAAELDLREDLVLFCFPCFRTT